MAKLAMVRIVCSQCLHELAQSYGTSLRPFVFQTTFFIAELAKRAASQSRVTEHSIERQSPPLALTRHDKTLFQRCDARL